MALETSSRLTMIPFLRNLSGARGDPVVPFRLIAGRIVVDATLDARAVTAIIDTGAAVSLVRAGLAMPLASKHARRIVIQSEHGPTPTDVAGPTCFSLGGLTLTLRDVVVLPPSFLAETGIDADMVVGQDVLAAAAVEIDFARQHIRLHDRSWRPGRGFVVVPVALDDRCRLTVDLDLEKAGRVSAIVDLGNNAALTMDAAFMRRNGLADGVATSSGLFATLGGVSETVAFSLPAFAIGGLSVVDAPVDALPCWSSPQPINIGMDVLRHFHLVLNLATAELGLRAIPDVQFEREMSGVLFAYRGSYLEVVHIARRSPAEAAGLQRGDRITAINDRPVDIDFFSGDLWRWRSGPAGRLIAIEMQRGRCLLRLAKYY